MRDKLISAAILFSIGYAVTFLAGWWFPWTSIVLGVLLLFVTVLALFDAKTRAAMGFAGFLGFAVFGFLLFRSGRAELRNNAAITAEVEKIGQQLTLAETTLAQGQIDDAIRLCVELEPKVSKDQKVRLEQIKARAENQIIERTASEVWKLATQGEAKEKQEAAKQLADAQVEAARKLVDDQKQAARKLLDTRKAELLRAKSVAEEVIPRAEQARAKADKAAEKVEKDSRIYNSIRVSPNNAARFGSAEARQRIQDSEDRMQTSSQLAESRQIAKEAEAQARQYKEEARQAVKDVDEAKASLRRAEEAAIHFGIK